jgi:hypothetical protein
MNSARLKSHLYRLPLKRCYRDSVSSLHSNSMGGQIKCPSTSLRALVPAIVLGRQQASEWLLWPCSLGHVFKRSFQSVQAPLDVPTSLHCISEARYCSPPDVASLVLLTSFKVDRMVPVPLHTSTQAACRRTIQPHPSPAETSTDAGLPDLDTEPKLPGSTHSVSDTWFWFFGVLVLGMEPRDLCMM